MSFTEIIGFDKEGNAYRQANIRNSWRGAMAIWQILEERYLPPYKPSWARGIRLDYKPSRLITPDDEKDIQEIWNLAVSDKVSMTDKIVLYTTFDKCLVKNEDLPKVIAAFNNFEGETSLKEQAKVLQDMYEDENCIAVGWNQTSVAANTWTNLGGYDKEKDEPIPYNCLKQTDHFWLFDELKLT